MCNSIFNNRHIIKSDNRMSAKLLIDEVKQTTGLQTHKWNGMVYVPVVWMWYATSKSKWIFYESWAAKTRYCYSWLIHLEISALNEAIDAWILFVYIRSEFVCCVRVNCMIVWVYVWTVFSSSFYLHLPLIWKHLNFSLSSPHFFSHSIFFIHCLRWWILNKYISLQR